MKQKNYELLKKLIEAKYWDIDIAAGKVKSKKTNTSNVKNKKTDLETYECVKINFASRQYKFYVHHIIAIAGGMNISGKTVKHKDNNIHNNSFNNLIAVIDQQYQLETFKDNKRKTEITCEKHPRTKLTNNDVAYIKYLLLKGEQGKVIAKLYNLSERTVSCIKLARTWKQIQPMQIQEAKKYKLPGQS